MGINSACRYWDSRIRTNGVVLVVLVCAIFSLKARAQDFYSISEITPFNTGGGVGSSSQLNSVDYLLVQENAFQARLAAMSTFDASSTMPVFTPPSPIVITLIQGPIQVFYMPKPQVQSGPFVTAKFTFGDYSLAPGITAQSMNQQIDDAIKGGLLKVSSPGKNPDPTMLLGVSMSPLHQLGLKYNYVITGTNAELKALRLIGTNQDAADTFSAFEPGVTGVQISVIPTDVNTPYQNTQNLVWHEIFWSGARAAYTAAVADAIALVGNGCPCAKAALDYKAAYEALGLGTGNVTTKNAYGQVLKPFMNQLGSFYDGSTSWGADGAAGALNNAGETFNMLNNPYPGTTVYGTDLNEYGQYLENFILHAHPGMDKGAAHSEAKAVSDALKSSSQNQQALQALNNFPASVLSGFLKSQGAPY